MTTITVRIPVAAPSSSNGKSQTKPVTLPATPWGDK